jgi:hypothetical protein
MAVVELFDVPTEAVAVLFSVAGRCSSVIESHVAKQYAPIDVIQPKLRTFVSFVPLNELEPTEPVRLGQLSSSFHAEHFQNALLPTVTRFANETTVVRCVQL